MAAVLAIEAATRSIVAVILAFDLSCFLCLEHLIFAQAI